MLLRQGQGQEYLERNHLELWHFFLFEQMQTDRI